MKIKLLILSLLSFCGIQAQTPTFTELSDTKPHTSEAQWDAQVKTPQAAWGSIDQRYQKTSIPQNLTAKWAVKAWKGERVNGQAVFFTSQDVKSISVSSTPLKNGKKVIPSSAVNVSMVRYVMTDELNKEGKKSGCRSGNIKSEWDSSIVADILDASKTIAVPAKTTRPIWINVWIPQETQPGVYKANLNINIEGKKTISLPYQITVGARTLPTPDKWKFHLDLWQNPYAVARYYNVPLWSKEHFDYMRPIMKTYADAGGKVITASIINRPWAGQTEDAFCSMIGKTKDIDGSWSYDYSVFDRWIEFMISCGITDQIDCYTVVPWSLEFDYYDKASNGIKIIKAEPGSDGYNNYWLPFLKDFASHLKTKGWFSRIAIAMDERPRESMNAAESIIRKADKDFKIEGAIHYYPDVEPNIYDLCLAYGETVPSKILERRKSEGKKTTVYTCCAEAYPNTFTFSKPAEATWIPLHASAIKVDGYLRWAYNSWTVDPLRDSRFRAWAAGDCYLVYPEASSIRMERLVEGIQYYEKIRILREEYAKNPSKIKDLELAVSKFIPQNLHGENATQMVNEFKKVINKY